MRILISLALVALLPLLGQSQDDKDKAKDNPQAIKVIDLKRTDPVIYEKEIEPIFDNKCKVCHGGQVKEGRLDITSYENLIKGGKRGKSIIVPGKGDESLLYKMAGKTEKPFMPPKGETPFSPQELALVKLWIDQGAKAPTTVRIRPKVLVSTPPPIVLCVRALAISPDKSQVVVGRGNQIHIYDGTGAFKSTLKQADLKTPDGKPVEAAHLSIVESLAVSPDGKLIASGSFQELVLWDAATGERKHKIDGFVDRVVALGFSPDGTLLATGGGAATEDGEIKVIDVANGKLAFDIKNGHSDTVFGVAFSPDGKMLATCGADKFVKVFEVPSGKFIKSFEGHTHHVMDVGWKADGKLLASAGADNSVKVWDFEKGEQARTIAAHTKQVTRLIFIGKTPQIVTCSGDQTVKVFNVDNGGAVRTIPAVNDYLYAVAVSPDGTLITSGGEEGIVRLYNGTTGALIKALANPGDPEPKVEPKK